MEGALPINAVNSVKLPSAAGEKNAKVRGEREKEMEIGTGCLYILLHQLFNRNVLYLSLSLADAISSFQYLFRMYSSLLW